MSSQSPYNLRSRLNLQSPAVRATSSAVGSIPKAGAGYLRKARSSEYTLQLQRVIGTTTNSPNGLVCCPETNSYAYCAGAVAVLSQLAADGKPTHKYYRARPTAASVNPPTSYYDASPVTTPSKRRISTFTLRKRLDEFNSASPGRNWVDDGGNQTWTARERIKSVSCVALSRDGKWLAVGEAGYNPRVLLYSASDEASCETPVSIVTDHTYGLRCVAFSSDMRYLATLGDYKDGFLFIWSFNSKSGQLTLHSANKCTANICEIKWCGNTLITVGTRCVRVWMVNESAKQTSSTTTPRHRPSEIQSSSPGPTPLAGRNALLGSLVDCTFTCVVPVSESKAVIGTDTGYLCLVDLTLGLLELKILDKLDLAISAVAYASLDRQLLIGTSRGVQTEDLDLLGQRESRMATGKRRLKTPRLSIRKSLGLFFETEKSVTAIGSLAYHTVTLDNNGSLQLQHIQTSKENEPMPTFAAHKSIILGVQTLPVLNGLGSFFTYSKNAEVRFWGLDGTLIRQELLAIDQVESTDGSCENELTQMRYLPTLDCFVSADRFGVLKITRNQGWKTQHTIRAHSSEITYIDIFDPAALVATCSRDRTVQLFHVRAESIDLLQTCDDHVGSVSQVLFAQQGTKLLSCSTDRSLVIRERVLREGGPPGSVAYVNTKVLSLKSSPLSMTMATESILAISTMDRSVTKADLSSGTLLESFKTGDLETNETVALNSLICIPYLDGTDDAQKMLVGYCSVDKSIRVYNEKNLSLLVRESGHTEGVSDLTLIPRHASNTTNHGNMLVSTGLDGTIMIWNVSRAATYPLTPGVSADQSTIQGLGTCETDVVRQSPASLPPMRKILSKVEMADLTRANGQLSPSSPQSLSPIRLKRKTSRLALSTSIEHVEQTPLKGLHDAPRLARSPKIGTAEARRSPSPPVRSTLRSQRSRPELVKDPDLTTQTNLTRSPSPPAIPIPPTPKQRNQANGSRLRRAPSVPADLYSQAAAQGRRQSMSQASEFGSLAMATDQAARMLKIYRKKLVNSKEKVDLTELEIQVSTLLKTIQERSDRAVPAQLLQGEMALKKQHIKAATESEVDQLTTLLEGSTIVDSPRTPTEIVSAIAAPG